MRWAGTSVGPMTFNDSYTLNGNPLTLTGDLSFATGTNIYVTFTCNVDLKLASSLHFRQAITSSYNGAIDVNGQTLTIDSYNTTLNGAVNGNGAIVITGSGIQLTNGGAFSGTISGVLDIQPDNADDHIAVGTRDVLAVAECGRAHGRRSLTPSDLFIAGRAAIR